MPDDRVAAPRLDRVDRLFELRVGERLDLPTFAADEVVVMRIARGLVADDPVADVDPLHEALRVEPLQHAVHAREADPPAERVVDLLRAEAAVLGVEVAEDARARAARPVAGLAELDVGVLGPGHWTMITRIVIVFQSMRIVLVLCAVLVLAGCGSKRGSVVAAFYPLAFAAQQVGGPTLRVENLTPAGAEPHDIELTPREVGDIQQAKVVLYLSHGFQPAVAEAVRSAHGRVVDALSGLALRPGDPHVWLDPVRYAHIVGEVGAALGRPRAAARLANRVRALDGAYRRGLAHCTRRTFVTTHAAFGYVADRYGLHQVAITGVDPESEPDAQKLASLARLVRSDHIHAVFFERLVSPKLAQTIAREDGVGTAVLDPIEGLTPAEQRAGATYFTLMRQNLQALRAELGCR